MEVITNSHLTYPYLLSLLDNIGLTLQRGYTISRIVKAKKKQNQNTVAQTCLGRHSFFSFVLYE
jgi:hypothetical protein